jgi:hypothetical protein
MEPPRRQVHIRSKRDGKVLCTHCSGPPEFCVIDGIAVCAKCISLLPLECCITAPGVNMRPANA